MLMFWVDSKESAPPGYQLVTTVKEANDIINKYSGNECLLFDLGYRAHDFFKDGGDYDNILYKIALEGRRCAVRFHDKDIMDFLYMQRIAARLGLIEVF